MTHKQKKVKVVSLLALSLLICLCVSLNLTTVKADSLTQSGEWDIVDYLEIGAGNSQNLSLATISYDITTSNTTLTNTLNFNEFTKYSGFLPNVQHENKEFYARLAIKTDMGITYLSAVEVKAWFDWYGAWAGRDVIFYMNDTASGIHHSQSYNNQTFTITMYLEINWATKAVTLYAQTYSVGYGSVGAVELPFNGLFTYTQDFSLPLGSTPESFIVYYGHTGTGDFHAGINTIPLTEPPTGDNGFNPTALLPEPLRQLITTVSNAITWFFAFLGLAGSVIVQVAPYTPLILVAYLIGIGFKCLWRKSFDPLMLEGERWIEIYTKIIGVLATIWQALASAGTWFLGLFGIIL